MHKPIQHLHSEAPAATRPNQAERPGPWLRALLRLFADLACRLR